MNSLKKLMDKQEDMFLPGGKLEKFYPLFEAGQSFLFNPKTKTRKGPHIRDSLETKRFMSTVIIALLPCTLFGIYNAGVQSLSAVGDSLSFIATFFTGLKIVLPIILTSYAVGGLWEALFAIVRKHEINEGFLVTGLLFPLTLPPTIPLWQVALGITFGVVIGKEIFGGTGKNFLNPALTARAFLYFAFPARMSGEVWTRIADSGSSVVDGFSGATALSVAAAVPAQQSAVDALIQRGLGFYDMFVGFTAGSIGETSTFMILIGALILLLTGVGSWRTMAGCVAGLFGMTFIFNLFLGDVTPYLALSPKWHLVMGGFAFGTVFMATDPVSSPDLHLSRWIYGVLIGALTVIIRVINPAYPEGIMLAVLLMNVFAPLIDHYVLKSQLKKRIPNVL